MQNQWRLGTKNTVGEKVDADDGKNQIRHDFPVDWSAQEKARLIFSILKRQRLY